MQTDRGLRRLPLADSWGVGSRSDAHQAQALPAVIEM